MIKAEAILPNAELTRARKIFYFFPVLFSFCLPFGSNLLSWLIVGWTFVSFFNWRKTELRSIFSHRGAWLLLVFFAATLVSALLSTNQKEAGFAIEVKMTFLIFPYLFFCFSWPLAILRRCVIAFVSGCFFATLYLLLRATSYSIGGQTEYFFYTLFSDFLHASYFSMYLLSALAFLMILYPTWFHQQKAILKSTWLFGAVFIAGIFLCASKMGLITFFIVFPLLLLYRWRGKFPLRKSLSLLLGLAILVALVLFMLPQTTERLIRLTQFSSTVDKTSSESSAVRLLIWEQCLEIIRERPILGQGVGDANDLLYQRYELNGLSGALLHRLNAHNQYFQTAIGLGFVGLLLLVLLTFWQLIAAFIKRRVLLLVFALIISLNFLVESMLQTSAGVLYFTFFYCYLHLCDRDLLIAAPLTNSQLNEKL